MNRRRFISKVGAISTVPFVFVRPAKLAMRDADLIIKGAALYDGTGSLPFIADLAIKGDKILAIGKDIQINTNASVIEARGLAVSPGFIDIHGHSDYRLLQNRNAESKIRQGMTTEVVGQDGGSMGPFTEAQRAAMDDYYQKVWDLPITFSDLAGFFGELEKEPASINLASMIGLGTVRNCVIGMEDRPASVEEVAAMQEHVKNARKAGACGVSTGLEYTPGGFASTEELIKCCLPFSGSGLPYSSHMRNEGDRLLQAIEEAITIASKANIPALLAHLKAQGQKNWWKAGVALDIIDRANQQGIDVSFDRYPYVAYSTGLGSLFPIWAREGSLLFERLEDESLSGKIESEVRDKVTKLGDWNSVQITSVASEDYKWVQGMRLGDAAKQAGVEPYNFFLQIIKSDGNRSSMVGFGMSEENTKAMLSHPRGMICSDGSARATYGIQNEGNPHPRTYGTFPRVLGHYVREQKAMTLETAIKKMTSMPAKIIGVSNRGVLKEGYQADLVTFDPNTIRDRATFENPHQYPEGISHVIVNGQLVIDEGAHTSVRSGQVVRPN